MRIKQNSIKKIICLLLFTLCCFFVTCKDSGGDAYDNEIVDIGEVKELMFSHNSGLYDKQFNLTIAAADGSEIYYSTDGSIPLPEKAGNGYVFKYGSPIPVKNRNGEKNVLATPQNSTNIYGYENDSRGFMPKIYIPKDNQVPKATVIRAIEVNSGGKQSNVATKTYFIGNNLANYGNNRIISLVSDPYNLVDTNYGIMVRGNPSNRWNSKPPYNFLRRGEEWEREAYLELFEGNTSGRSVRLSTGAGIRIRGGWSRAAGQKSFNVYFKERYGINNLKNYVLIPGAVKADGKTPVTTYKSFMLRNGGNDGEYTKFYDVFLQDLLSDRSYSTQAAVPCVVYINGEYWGPYNIQERYSDNHTEYKYGVKKENVISYDNGELDDGTKADEALFWQMMNMKDNNMADPAKYSAFCDLFDIENFIDYWAAEIYIYNEDWPHNNYRVWRTRNDEAGNPYGDKKWRYQMFDTEFALGIYNSGGLTGQSGKNAFDEILTGTDKNHHNNKLFKALLANPDFCRQFVNTMMDLYNVNFHPDSFTPKLNYYAAVYKPLMDGYFERWGNSWTTFDNKVNDAKKYLTNIRAAMVNNYLPAYFGGYSGIANIGISGGNLRDVTLAVTGAPGASIKINTVTPNLASGNWTGKYYSGIPITVRASVPPDGYEFEGWAVTGGNADFPSALTTTVNFTGNTQVTAKYKLK
jgi:CotH protein.